MARQPKPINWAIVDKRIEAGNSAATIARAFDIDVTNFYDRFLKEYGCSFTSYANSFPPDQRKLTRNENIEYTQYMKALSGNVTMLIRLGTVWCGQKEHTEDKESPYQDQIEKDHLIMRQQYEIDELKKQLELKNE